MAKKLTKHDIGGRILAYQEAADHLDYVASEYLNEVLDDELRAEVIQMQWLADKLRGDCEKFERYIVKRIRHEHHC